VKRVRAISLRTPEGISEANIQKAVSVFSDFNKRMKDHNGNVQKAAAATATATRTKVQVEAPPAASAPTPPSKGT
jgi:hypothetical protein